MDTVGMEIAYSAYKTWKENKNAGIEEKSLPGLETYSNDQVFWMSYSMLKCIKYTREGIEKRIKRFSNVYAPGEFRVIGTLSNQPEFSSVYNCTKYSKMNPLSKCQIF